ncbi:MAG TPA: hypothetical protein PKE69_13820 [Pyrinomonadaceae bacterium]|nr:hypothetical protein [Pyrinomonadaceae bacterium]
MIISKDTNPERELYYLGALVIDVLGSFSANEVDLLDAFQKLNEKEKVSMNLFALTLDWLFVLGLVKSNQSNLEKCF